MVDALTAKVAEIMRTPTSEVDPEWPLYTYGVDSLVVMEVRSWIVREMQVEVGLFDILLAIPMHQLAVRLAEKSSLVSQGL